MSQSSEKMSKLSKKFKGLILSNNVLNKDNIVPNKIIQQFHNEIDFLKELTHNIMYHSTKSKSDKTFKDQIDENQYFKFLEQSFDCFPLKDILYKKINLKEIPEYPSFFIFPLIYILIADISDEIDIRYKSEVINKLVGLTKTNEINGAYIFEVVPWKVNDSGPSKEKLRQSSYIGFFGLMEHSVKNDHISHSDRASLLRMMNVVNNMWR